MRVWVDDSSALHFVYEKGAQLHGNCGRTELKYRHLLTFAKAFNNRPRIFGYRYYQTNENMMYF